MPRPKEIADIGLFTYDHRHDGSRFWFLKRAIRSIVNVGSNGQFIRPGMIEDEIVNEPGNVGIANFPLAFLDGQVWVIDHFGFHNGGAAAVTVSGVLVYKGEDMHVARERATIGVGQNISLLPIPITIDADVGVAIIGGAAADTYSIHAKRVA